jgi:tetratricopeptide (TPR) repeat protein
MNDHIQNVKDLFEYLYNTHNSTANDWDMLFLGLAPPTTDSFSLKRFTDKVLPCKEAYFVNKKTASRLVKSWSENKLSHSLRVQLSKYLKNNTDIKVMYTNQRVTLDGSKLGLFPTTINRRNILFFNAEYIKLFHIFNSSKEDIKEKYNEAKSVYKLVQSNNGMNPISPDITHIFGLIEYKLGNYDQAEELFTTAILETVKQQGLITNNCELLTNAIINYGNVQKDVNAIFTNPSKYETQGIIPFLD